MDKQTTHVLDGLQELYTHMQIIDNVIYLTGRIRLEPVARKPVNAPRKERLDEQKGKEGHA